MPGRREQLEQALIAQETLRGIVADTIIDAAIAAIQREIDAIDDHINDDEDTGVIFRQRKLITVLFTDIVNSTRLVQGLDPEDISFVMDTALKQLSAVIPEHNGHATRFMGDGFKAVFGLDITREDDAERAVRAGLDILEASKVYAIELEENWGLKGFNVRVGINTGWVVTGGYSEGEDTVMGVTVNLAARMESAAPAGGVLISHDTYRLVRELFDVEPVKPVIAKGFAEPVPAYHVLQVKPRAFHRITPKFEGLETKTIGRDEELKIMQDVFAEVIETRQLRVITLLGEPGVGKSRLLYEFENWADLFPTPTQFYKARANKELQHQTLGLIRDSLVYRLKIRETNSPHVVRKLVEANLMEGLKEHSEPEMKAHFIGDLLGFDYQSSPFLKNVRDDPQQISARARGYLIEFFQHAARHTPIIVLLEDLHWADESSLDVIQNMAFSRLADFPFLIVGAARPSLLNRRPNWSSPPKPSKEPEKQFHHLIPLAPLSTEKSLQLVNEILQKVNTLPDPLCRLITEHADGNALFIEEMVKMLIEDEVIVKGPTYWKVTQTTFENIRVPETLEEILLARQDSLPPPERQVLQQASVIGRIFWDQPLIHLNRQLEDGLPESTIFDSLDNLCKKEIVIVRERSAFPKSQEYMFNHAAMRDVVYKSVLRKIRRTYHHILAEWLIESQPPDGKFLGMIGDHLEMAEEITRARQYLHRAGEQAAEKFANADAIQYFTRALALCQEDEYETCFILTLAREKVLDMLGKRDKQQEDIKQMKNLGAKLENPVLEAEALLREASFAYLTGDFPHAIETAQNAVALAPTDSFLQPEGSLQLGSIYMRTGKTKDAWKWFNRALESAQSIHHVPLEATIIRHTGILAYYEGKFIEAKTHFFNALELFKSLNDLRGEASSLNNLGAVEARQGFPQAAKPYFEKTLAIRQKIGDRRGEGATCLNLGNIYLDTGEFDQAITYYQAALEIAQETYDRNGESRMLHNMGIIYSNLGVYAEAKSYYEKAIRISQEINDKRGQTMNLGNISQVNYHLGNLDEASEQVQIALNLAREINDRSNEGHALTTQGNILLKLGCREEALEAYLEVGEIGQESGQQTLIYSSLAGQIEIALENARPETILSMVNELVFELAQTQTAGIQQTSWVFWICYRALDALNDPRAKYILQTAYDLIHSRAVHIQDGKMRQSFLENVATHREIIEAYERK